MKYAFILIMLAACGGKKRDDGAGSASASASDAAKPPAIVVKPAELLRTAGDAAIQPDPSTAQAMTSSGRKAVISSWKVCVDATGAVDEASAITPSGFVTWDTALAAGIRGWRFQPIVRGGAPVRACTSFTFAWRAG